MKSDEVILSQFELVVRARSPSELILIIIPIIHHVMQKKKKKKKLCTSKLVKLPLIWQR
jgi:hypothetical protein